jgi:hypothetical protein
LGISFFKIALLISYLRLFKGTNHTTYRRVVWGAIFFVVLGHLGCALTLILACQPVHKSWDPLTPGTCLAAGPSFTAYAIVTIISDITVAVIPIPVLVQLKVGNGKKIGLIVIFLLGLFTTLCSVFRYLEIDRIQNGDGNSTMLILWGVIEFNVGVRPFSHLFWSSDSLLNIARTSSHRCPSSRQSFFAEPASTLPSIHLAVAAGTAGRATSAASRTRLTN